MKELSSRISSKFSFNESSSNFETMVDIGGNIFAQAVVPQQNLDSIFVHIGFGFHVPLTLEEIPKVVHERLAILQRKHDIAEVEYHTVTQDFHQVPLALMNFYTK